MTEPVYEEDLVNLGFLNKKLNNSSHFLKPTNKEIANVLGLCERQVNYYIKALKNINNKENETS